MSKGYNGHRNWTHWNVAFWLGPHSGLCTLKSQHERCGNKDIVARKIHDEMALMGITETPNGAKFSITAIRAALAE